MSHLPTALALATLCLGAACAQTTATTDPDACGARAYQSLVGGPSRAVTSLEDIPGSSRHYGSQERVATDDTTRLNFVHSGTTVESVTDPDSTIIRVFCG